MSARTWYVEAGDLGSLDVYERAEPFGPGAAGPFTELEAWEYAAGVHEDRRRLNAPYLAAAKRKVRKLKAKADRERLRAEAGR